MEKLNLYKVLIFGLPGSGKSTFANKLIYKTNWCYFNGDGVRALFNDWDFSNKGRIRQAERMYGLTKLAHTHSIIDFVCPYKKYRNNYDITIWMNTIQKGRYKDTNKLFEKPDKVDYEIKEFKYRHIIKEIRDRLQ